MGRRGVEATSSTIHKSFPWDGMSRDVVALVGGCIHCIVNQAGRKIPRPLASVLHCLRPGEVVHVELLYLGPITTGQLHVLILRDDFPGLCGSLRVTRQTVTQRLMQSRIGSELFGCMDWIAGDQKAHFKNKIMEAFRKWFRFSHNFTTVCTPWANGIVERVCKEVKRSCMSLRSEWKPSPRECSSVTECFKSILNQAPLKRLGNRTGGVQLVLRCPLEAFTGMRPSRPLTQYILRITKMLEVMTKSALCNC